MAQDCIPSIHHSQNLKTETARVRSIVSLTVRHHCVESLHRTAYPITAAMISHVTKEMFCTKQLITVFHTLSHTQHQDKLQ